MNQPLPQAQIVDRYENRRKMAWLSFYAFSAMGIALVLLGVLFGYEQEVNAMFTYASFTMGLWAAVVGAYFGVTYGTDKAEMRHNASMDLQGRPPAAQHAAARQPLPDGPSDRHRTSPDASGGVVA